MLGEQSATRFRQQKSEALNNEDLETQRVRGPRFKLLQDWEFENIGVEEIRREPNNKAV